MVSETVDVQPTQDVDNNQTIPPVNTSIESYQTSAGTEKNQLKQETLSFHQEVSSLETNQPTFQEQQSTIKETGFAIADDVLVDVC